MKDLLVFGGDDDPHTLRACRVLARRGTKCYYFDPLKSPQASVTGLNVESSVSVRGRVLDSELEEDICLSDVVIWWRTKRIINYVLTKNDQISDFAISENTSLMRYLMTTLNATHFNDRLATYIYENKIRQMRTASELGWLVPEYIVSSKKNDVIEFFNRFETVIAKPLRKNFLPPPLEQPDDMVNLMVNKIKIDEILNASDESIEVVPEIYQK